MATHGKGFVRASKDAWDLLEQRDLRAVADDDAVGAVLGGGCSLGGAASALVGAAWTLAARREELTAGVAVVAFCIGYFMTDLTSVVVSSGVATYQLCYAEDSGALRLRDPVFYEKLRDRQTALRR